jgi:tRNA A-37 threonylcarbamoyl transferase component Bud32
VSAEQRIQQADRLMAAGHEDEAMRVLLAVVASDPVWRDAARRLVHLAWSGGRMSYELERFFQPLLRGIPPLRPRLEDTATLYWLGRLYERDEVEDSAQIAYRACDRLSPGFEDVAERLKTLRRSAPTSLPDLPDLPELPEPATPRAPARKPVHSESNTMEFDHRWRSPVSPKLTAAVKDRSADLGLGPVVPGAIVADRFRVEAPIGEGGYAIVFRVTDLMMEEPAALKLFRRQVSDDAALKRFKQEMKVTRRLFHPSIVKTYEFGTWAGLYFITMELLEGRDLAEELRRARGPLAIGRALDIAAQAFDGLSAAHAEGVVHRDVKPENLFLLDEDDVVKVMDFGVAHTPANNLRATSTGKVVGTPSYIAPERLGEAGEGVGPSGDVYAMGLVLYEMLTAQLPWTSQDIAGLFNEILNTKAPPPSAWNPAVPAALDALVAELLEKDPKDRVPSAAVAAERLRMLAL